MIYLIKKILYKLLSEKAYLRILHRGFYLLYNLGVLKNDERFKYHYLIKDIIEPDYTIVDIGANLGYFSKSFSKLASNGRVISIEPVNPFYETLVHFLGNRKNVTIHNCALGQEEGTITMVMPESNGMIRTGLPHIAESEEEKALHRTHEVKIRKGSQLLGGLEKIDYIKCDIEGYERPVFEEMVNVIEKYKPIVQIELGKETEAFMINYFTDLGYIQYGVAKFKVVREKSGTQQEQGDFLFVPEEKAKEFEEKMKTRNRF